MKRKDFDKPALLVLLSLLALGVSLFLPWKWLSALALIASVTSFVFFFLRIRRSEARQERRLCELESSFQLDDFSDYTLEERLLFVSQELERRNSALCASLLQKRISSEHELGHALEGVAALAKDLFLAVSAEISLFDKDTGAHHTSFVVGLPGTREASKHHRRPLSRNQKALTHDPNSVYTSETPISFAGDILGVLRVTLPPGIPPASGDQELLDLLASQASIAIVNTEYSKQILRMKNASDESVRAKTGFLANLSHELRGPLGIMLNAVDLVLDKLCGPISDEQVEILRMVRSNGSHLLELVNDVLDYAKVESGKITPQPVPILVNELLTDIFAVVRKQAETKRHSIVIGKLDDALAMQCDKRHIRQILINLLTNAIKYTPDGGSIHLFAERRANQRIRISVKDSGIGIAESDREKVFAAFERIENSYSITQVGSGLGMALTKKLVEANSGTIDFESEVNAGSHFYVSFPARDAAHIRFEQAVDEAPKVKGHGEVILLAQRDEGERQMLSRYLVHLGFCVVQVDSEAALVEVMKKQDANVLVLDNDIVDTNERDVIAEIRVAAKRVSVPMLLITSRAFSFDIEHYIRSGVDRCLVKPLDLVEFSQTCKQLMDAEYRGVGVDEEEKPEEEKPLGPLSGKIIRQDIVH